MTEFLLAHRAEVDANDKDGDTPLHYATRSGRADVAALLLAHKADVNASNTRGKTPLRWATDWGHCDAEALLRQHSGHE